MRTRLAAPLLLFLLAAPSLLGAADREGLQSAVKFGTKWLPVEEALREGKRAGKPVLVVAWARWCPACRQMFREIMGGGASNSFSAEFQKRFVLAEVEVDAKTSRRIHYKGGSYSQDEFAQAFIPSPGIPWFTVFDAKGDHREVSFDTSRLPHALVYFTSPKIAGTLSFDEFTRQNPLR